MKQILVFTLFMLSLACHSQNPCDISTNVTDSIGTYHATTPYLVHERNFGEDKSYLYLSVTIIDGTPTLKYKQIRRSKSFMVADCFSMLY